MIGNTYFATNWLTRGVRMVLCLRKVAAVSFVQWTLDEQWHYYLSVYRECSRRLFKLAIGSRFSSYDWVSKRSKRLKYILRDRHVREN